MENELKVIDRRKPEESLVQLADNSPAALMMVAISKGMDLDKLEKFMALQERHEANEARKAYHEAMAAFKSEAPEIEKDKTVSYLGQGKTTSYTHASLGNVTAKINSALSVHGLSAGWKTEQEGGNIKVTCTITHKMGHSESTSLTAAPDTSGSKNSIQAVGSTISYLERYTILALTGLATHDMDDDGKSAEEIEYITVDQQTDIKDKLKEYSIPESEFLAYLAKTMKIEQIESVEKIPDKGYAYALAVFKAKESAIAKAKKGAK